MYSQYHLHHLKVLNTIHKTSICSHFCNYSVYPYTSYTLLSAFNFLMMTFMTNSAKCILKTVTFIILLGKYAMSLFIIHTSLTDIFHIIYYWTPWRVTTILLDPAWFLCSQSQIPCQVPRFNLPFVIGIVTLGPTRAVFACPARQKKLTKIPGVLPSFLVSIAFSCTLYIKLSSLLLASVYSRYQYTIISLRNANRQ